MPAIEAVRNFQRAVSILSEYRDPDDLAEFFYDIGIRGHRGKCETCPVANFLACAVGPEYTVLVDGMSMSVVNDAGVAIAEANAPDAVEEFIGRFDTDDAVCDCRDCRGNPDIYNRLVMDDHEPVSPLI